MKRLLFFFFLYASSAFAQGVIVAPKTVLGTTSGLTRPIPNATVTVCAAGALGIPCAPPLAGATFKDAALTQPLSNPFTTDVNGNYQFAIAQGTYTVTETGALFSGYSYQLTVTGVSVTVTATNLLGPGSISGTFGGNYTTTGNNTHSGTETFTGPFNASAVKNFSNVLYMTSANGTSSDQGWTGSDPCAWLTNLQSVAVPASGSFVDARGLQGLFTTCASSFSVGGVTSNPVQLLKGYDAWQVPNTVTVNGASSIIGPASNWRGSGYPSRIIAKSGTFPNNTTLLQIDNTGITFSVTLMNFELDCAAITGCTTLDMGKLQDTGLVSGMWLTGWMNNCIATQPAATGENFVLERLNCAASATAPSTAVGISLNSVADHYELRSISVVGNATPIAADYQCNACSAGATVLHAEAATDGWQAVGGTAKGTSHIGEIDCLSNVTNCVHIKSGFNGSLFIGAINTLNSGSPVSFLIDAGVVGTNAVTCNDAFVGDFYINTTGAQPILRSSCSNVPNQYLSSGSAGVNGFLFPNGQGMNLIDNTASHAATIAFGLNVIGPDLVGWYDKSAAKNLFYCSRVTPFGCFTPASISPQAASGGDLGTTLIPWGNLWLGTGGAIKLNSTTLISQTAPTIAGAGCGGTVAAIQNANGTASFEIFTGTAPTSAGCTVTFPAAAHHWICPTITHTSAVSTTNFIILQTGALSSTSVTFQLFSDVAAATAPAASDTWAVSGCHAN